MAKDYKVYHVKGDDQLAHCLSHEEIDGYELFEIIWTGNLQANMPSIVAPGGEPTKLGIIHLYLVVFVRLQEKVETGKFPLFDKLSDS